jgi:hypothetical protein
MDRRQIGLKLVMDQLDQQVKVDTFEDRLILQKTVYLADAAGVHLGYFFRWYLRGPYCPDVADDGFAVALDVAWKLDDSNRWNLDGASCKRLVELRPLLTGEDRAQLALSLELLASVHYLIERKQVKDTSVDAITRKLHACDKPFSQDQVAGALQELRAYGILS